MTPRSAITRQVLATLVVVTLTACGRANSEANADAAESQPSSSEPRYGGQVVIGLAAEPTTFNPAYIADIPSWNVSRLVFASLLRVNDRYETEPMIAVDQPTVSADGTLWTVQLRRGVRFHDGVELTAHDVVFTYRSILHENYTGPRGSSFRTLASVEAVDDYTVRFTLSEPDARFGGSLSLGILPKHLLDDVPAAERGNYRAFNVDRPIGAGPFKLVSWTAGQNLLFEAFDNYFEGRPYLDRIAARVVPNGSAGVLLLETGEVDLMLAPVSEVPNIERLPSVTLHRVPVAGYEYVGWNLRNELFADRRVRQALTHAVDRQEIVDALFGGHTTVAHAAVPPAMAWAYTDDVPKFPYDPERARALLREAGWTPGPDGVLTRNGRRFSFTLLSDEGSDFRTDIAAILQQALGRVGVEVKPAQMEFGAFLARIDPPNFDFDAYMTSVIHTSDPDPATIWHSRSIERGFNNIAFRHPRVDELADLNTRLLDRTERAAMLKELWQIIAEEQPYLFLFYAENPVAVRSRVRGYTPNPLVLTEAANHSWLARDE